MAFTLDNFVRSILAVDAAVGDTSLVVALAAPPLRDPPAASAGNPGILILQDQPTSPTKIEIVTYTGVSIAGTQVTLTGVTRGLEGTSAQAWTAGTQTFSGTTAAVLAQFALKAALATVATSGSYTDLANKPTLGTAAAQNTTAFATAAQGAKADSAVQPNSLASLAALELSTSSPYIDFHYNNTEADYDVRIINDAAGQLNVVGTLKANNLSGTNTGDQDLSGLQPKLGYTPVQQGTGVGQGVNAVKIGWSGTGLKATIDVTDLGVFAFQSWVSSTFAPIANRPAVYVQSADPGAVPDGSLWFW